MRRLSALGVAAGALLLASPVAGTPGGRPVALVTAETSNEVLAVALGETAKVIVRLSASNPRRPRVVGRLHPPHGAHDVAFTPDGTFLWVTSPTASQVTVYSAGGKLLEGTEAGRGPQHVAFSGSD